jgi:hypothetical protein
LVPRCAFEIWILQILKNSLSSLIFFGNSCIGTLEKIKELPQLWQSTSYELFHENCNFFFFKLKSLLLKVCVKQVYTVIFRIYNTETNWLWKFCRMTAKFTVFQWNFLQHLFDSSKSSSTTPKQENTQTNPVIVTVLQRFKFRPTNHCHLSAKTPSKTGIQLFLCFDSGSSMPCIFWKYQCINRLLLLLFFSMLKASLISNRCQQSWQFMSIRATENHLRLWVVRHKVIADFFLLLVIWMY